MLRPKPISHAASLPTSILPVSADTVTRRGRGSARKASYYNAGWCDAYGYALVATGQVEIALDPITNVWDCGPIRRSCAKRAATTVIGAATKRSMPVKPRHQPPFTATRTGFAGRRIALNSTNKYSSRYKFDHFHAFRSRADQTGLISLVRNEIVQTISGQNFGQRHRYCCCAPTCLCSIG